MFFFSEGPGSLAGHRPSPWMCEKQPTPTTVPEMVWPTVAAGRSPALASVAAGRRHGGDAGRGLAWRSMASPAEATDAHAGTTPPPPGIATFTRTRWWKWSQAMAMLRPRWHLLAA